MGRPTTSSVPLAPGAVPVLGHALALARDPYKLLRSLTGADELLRLHLGPLPVLLATTPELATAVMVDDATFDKGGLLFDKGREFLGNGLLVCARKDHRRQRRLVQPAFHPSRIPGYSQVMTQHADRATSGWQDGQTIDALVELGALTAGIAMDTMFTPGPAPVSLTDLVEDITSVARGTFLKILTPSWLTWWPVPAAKRYEQAIYRMRRTGQTMIDHLRAVRTGDRGDLLSILLPGTGDSVLSDVLVDHEVVDQVLTFFTGGIETTVTLLCWACHLISVHPEVQRAMQQEADRVLGDRAATHDDIERLRLSQAVLKETLRLYPPGWLLTRRTSCATDLGGHRIPARTIVAVCPYLLHHRSDRYPDPERFDPYRWDNADGGGTGRTAFLPFGAGPRKCIGDVFALNEATVVLATLAARWTLHPDTPGPGPIPAPGASMRPRRLSLRVTARRHTPASHTTESPDHSDPTI